jgi:cell fate regulator YaaT (PSP1 superfamily)
MPKIVGVKFKNNLKIQHLDCARFVLKKGDKIIMMTDEGPVIGEVVIAPLEMLSSLSGQSFKEVFRLPVEDEIERYEKNCILEEEVFQFCEERIEKRSLPMCLVSVERRFDESKIVVCFTAEDRVDFRELLKDLVGKFHTRIEMRHIGVRQEAGMVSGIGTCGRTLCCATFLNDFVPVTIKMAKKQNISLNPNKISGMCGRLMCCLAYEYKYYEKIKKNCPSVGKNVTTKYGSGKVARQNILKETITVVLESGEMLDIETRDILKRDSSKKRKKKK